MLSPNAEKNVTKALPVLKKREPLALHTTFAIGGPADYFCIAKTRATLAAALTWAQSKRIAYYILGRGSNVLVSDQGFRGLVIKILNKACILQDGQIICEAGASLGDLIRFAFEHHLAGLEGLTGIPGTVGGAVYGNAGAFSQSIGEVVKKVETFDPEKFKTRNYSQKECKFGYRDSIFKHNKEIILAVTFLLERLKDRKEILAQIKKIKAVRSRHPYQKCAGSVFKNIATQKLPPPPPSSPHPSSGRRGISRAGGEILLECNQHDEIKVACLIEKLGLKGKIIGGAEISAKHANFIVNKNNAKAEDVWNLIDLVRKKVYKEYGIVLETEIQFVGFEE